MQNFPNNIVPTSLYCNKYYTRCASACQCPSDGRSLTGQSTVPSTRVWRITSATRKTLWRLRAAATPSSATLGPRERSSGHHFCGGAAETDGTVHRSLSCTSDIKATPISQKAECPADMYPEFWTHKKLELGAHGCLSEFCRRHPFCFLLDSFVVVVIYVAVNSLGKCFKRGILFFMPVDISFSSVQRGLHDAIVVTVALP